MTTEKKLAARWVQHFKEMLNLPELNTPANRTFRMIWTFTTCNPPSQADVETAIKAMKNGKSPGIDSRQVELLKADATASSLVLADLFTKIWNLLGIPIDWSKNFSLIFFLVAIGWVICETTSDRPRGIQWTLVSRLEEPDFADDLADTSATQPSPGKIQLTKQFCKANRSAHYRYKDPGDLPMSIPLQHSQSPSVERNYWAGLHWPFHLSRRSY